MEKKSLTLELLLETHEQPFIIVNTSLTVIAVNKAWEISFGIKREEQIGKTCCHDNSACRHKTSLIDLGSYEGFFQIALRSYLSPIFILVAVICSDITAF